MIKNNDKFNEQNITKIKYFIGKLINLLEMDFESIDNKNNSLSIKPTNKETISKTINILIKNLINLDKLELIKSETQEKILKNSSQSKNIIIKNTDLDNQLDQQIEKEEISLSNKKEIVELFIDNNKKYD
ncbi:MAG TPA: hypothetical protein QKA14_00565 [Candidatus Megaira endosymbiont of Hartmannula sinica]|nr:hypothetical protein [Candidatus Megaera endosymbiont of Hartmannula sinica]